MRILKLFTSKLMTSLSYLTFLICLSLMPWWTTLNEMSYLFICTLVQIRILSSTLMQTFMHTNMHTSAHKCTLTHSSLLNCVYKHNLRLKVASLQQMFLSFFAIYKKWTISPLNFSYNYKTYFFKISCTLICITICILVYTICKLFCINNYHAALTLWFEK